MPLRSLVVILVLTVLAISNTTVVLWMHYTRGHLLQRDLAVVQQLLQVVADSVDARSYFFGNARDRDSAILQALFQRIAHMPEIISVQVVGADGATIWSARPSRRLGKSFQPGGSFIKLRAPIYEGGDRIGAVELSKSRAAVFAGVANRAPVVWAAAMLGVATLYGLLLWLFLSHPHRRRTQNATETAAHGRLVNG